MLYIGNSIYVDNRDGKWQSEANTIWSVIIAINNSYPAKILCSPDSVEALTGLIYGKDPTLYALSVNPQTQQWIITSLSDSILFQNT